MAFKTVTLTPSIPTGTYAVNDVLFNPTKLQLPARGAKLVSLFFVDTNQQLNADALQILFFQKNTHDLGTQNATANISVANFRENQFMGAAMMSKEVGGITPLDNINVRFGDKYYDNTDSNITGAIDLVLNSIEAGNAIYAAGLLDSTSTDPNFSTADSLDIVLGFEY